MSPSHSRTCNSAKRIPRAAVIMVQRKAAALFPARAACNPINIVKLLVKRTKVISATLVMLWNGLGQSADPLRKNPYATRHAAKVMVSAIMKSHIASFFVGIENAGPTDRPVACPSRVESAWLTVPPNFSNRLQLYPKQQKQVQPKQVHEMPVARRCIQRAPSQRRLTQLANHIDNPGESPQHMQCMGDCQHIEKGTAWIRRQIEPLGPQLRPRDILTSHKNHAKAQGHVQPARWAADSFLYIAHKCGDTPARKFQGYAAREQYKRVEEEDRRQRKAAPVQR